jgi:hypothetical protein
LQAHPPAWVFFTTLRIDNALTQLSQNIKCVEYLQFNFENFPALSHHRATPQDLSPGNDRVRRSEGGNSARGPLRPTFCV